MKLRRPARRQRSVPIRPGEDWIHWDGGSTMTCVRCKDSYAMALPASLGIVHAILTAFITEHRKCTERAKTG